jgi:hypothetical protein
MRERPIIFSGPMVRAIIEGRKTQTRRVVKPQPRRADDAFDGTWDWQNPGYYDDLTMGYELMKHAPYAEGDRLWVRETWWHHKECRPPFPHGGPGVCVRYESEVQPGDPTNAYDRRSPIHMPRWASRLTLEVTGVRVERLQDITPDDARAEGHPHVPGTERYPQEVHDDAARDWFMDLWHDLNAKRGYPWESNPWVWVVEFRRVES